MAYSVNIVTPPSGYPVSLDEAKLYLALDADLIAYDPLIQSLIAVATQKVEDYCQRKLLTTGLQLSMDYPPIVTNANYYPVARVELPYAGPLQTVDSVTYTTFDGTVTPIDPAKYMIDTTTSPGRWLMKPLQTFPLAQWSPSSAVKIEYTVGYGDSPDDVPEIYKMAIKLFIGFFFDNRNLVAEKGAWLLPKVVTDLLYTHRLHTAIGYIDGVQNSIWPN